MGKFGITEETRSSGIVTFKLSEDKPFNLAMIESVVAEEIEIKKGDKKGEKVVVLSIKFVGADKVSEHTERFFPISDDDAKYDVKQDMLNGKIKHLYECFAEFPAGGIGTKAKNFTEYFEAIANAFNGGAVPKEGTEDKRKAIYAGVVVWIKFNFNNNGMLQLPLPNFVEKAVKLANGWQEPKILRKTNRDVLTMPVAGGAAGGATTTGTGFNPKDLPPGF